MNMNRNFTRIPNDVLEALCALDISGNEMRIILYIIRRTYGFNRDFAEISLSEIASAVGMSTPHVSRALKKLTEMGLLERHPAKGIRPQTISLSNEFMRLPEMETVAENDNSAIAENGNSPAADIGNSALDENGNHTYKERKTDIKERERKARGQYGCVLLSDDEFRKLTDDYGESNTQDYIRKVDAHVKATGRKYSDHAAVIRKWMEDDNIKKDDFDISKYEWFINRF